MNAAVRATPGVRPRAARHVFECEVSPSTLHHPLPGWLRSAAVPLSSVPCWREVCVAPPLERVPCGPCVGHNSIMWPARSPRDGSSPEQSPPRVRLPCLARATLPVAARLLLEGVLHVWCPRARIRLGCGALRSGIDGGAQLGCGGARSR